MIVLGLDPSLTGYGWALIDSEKEGTDSVLDYGVMKTKAKTFMPQRYRDLADGLEEIIVNSEHEIDWVGIEHPPFNASYSLGLYALYMYTIEVLMNHRLGFVYFLPSQLKAFVRSILDDKGKMFKSDMKDAMKKLLNDEWEGRLNNNVADAFLVGYHAARFRQLLEGELSEDDLTEKEAQAWTKTIKRRKTGKIDKVGMIYQEDEKFFLLTDEKFDYLYEDE
jgi:Holliday junction resolvasome RuvABC endonuclease subunit